jgi:CBS domain-containing protein
MKVVEELLEHKGRDVWYVSPDATVHQAARIMSDRNVGAVLVCSGSTLLGILSERDCMRRVLLQGRSAHEVLVAAVMSTTVTTVTPHDSVAHCMQLMTDQRLRHLPVVEDDQLVGLISIGDAVKAQLHEQEQLISGLEGYIHGTSATPYPPAP